MSSLLRLGRAVRAAPWARAAPLVLILVAVLTTGMVVADVGGWRGVYGSRQGIWITSVGGYYDPSLVERLLGDRVSFQFALHGAQWFVGLAALLVACAVRGRRWPTVVLIAALAIVLAGWVTGGSAHLQYVTAVLHSGSGPSRVDGLVEIQITLYAVVGLLLAVALVTALLWAIAGTRARRRGPVTRPDRPPRRVAPLAFCVAVAVTLPLPRLAMWLRDVGRRILDVPGSYNEQTIYLLVAITLAVLVAAACLPRRQPAAAIAALAVGAALWIPALWMLSAVVPPLSSLDNSAIILALWVVWALGGLIGGGLIAARAARASAPA